MSLELPQLHAPLATCSCDVIPCLNIRNIRYWAHTPNAFLGPNLISRDIQNAGLYTEHILKINLIVNYSAQMRGLF